MPRVELSERLLSIFTTRERAASIVGDFLEADSRPIAYWRAVLRTVIGLSWRLELGIAFAVAIELFLFLAVNRSATAAHPMGPPASFFALFMAPLAMAAAFSAIRFGPTELLTRLSSALAIFAAAGFFLRWAPLVTPACGCMIAALVVVSSFMLQARKALRRIFAASIAGVSSTLMMQWVVSSMMPSCRGGCNINIPFFSWLGLAWMGWLMIPAVLVAAATCWPGPTSLRSRPA